MIGLLDIGNSRFKFVTYSLDKQITSAEQLAQSFSMITSASNEELTGHWLNEHFKNVTHLIFANVSEDKHCEIIKSWAFARNVDYKKVATEHHYNGVTNGYDNFQQMGVDRWLALLGVKQLFPTSNCLIIDSGTATTFDVIDKHGMHHGGWILPGVDMMANSVLNATAKVKGNSRSVKKLAFGKSTSDNLSLASWAATVGAVEQAVILSDLTNQSPEKVIFTGGNGESLMMHCESIKKNSEFIYIEKLIFIGLACYLEQ